MNSDPLAAWPPENAGQPDEHGNYYCIGALLAQAKAMGIPSFPPRQPPIIHPCPTCREEIFVQFRGCGLRPLVFDADGETEHECPPEERWRPPEPVARKPKVAQPKITPPPSAQQSPKAKKRTGVVAL